MLKEKNKEKYNIVSDKYIANLPYLKMLNQKVNTNLEYYIDKFIDYCVKYYKQKFYEIEWNAVIKKVINDIANWYEMEYSNTKITELYSGTQMVKNTEMLNRFKNLYLSKINPTEMLLLDEPKFPEKVYLSKSLGTYLLLDSKGIIISAEGIFPLTKEYEKYLISLIKLDINEIKKELKNNPCQRKMPENYAKIIEYLTNKNIKDVIPYLEKNKFIKSDNEVYLKLQNYYLLQNIHKELLNCVMYTLLLRDNKIGPKRALIFAFEFSLNIDIPIIYGLYSVESQLDAFLKTYLNLGGNENLVCFKNNNQSDTISVYDYLYKITENTKILKFN